MARPAFRPAKPIRAFDRHHRPDSGDAPRRRAQSWRPAAERELAEQFAVSRNTVREAMRMLEIRGLVELRRGAAGGAFIA
jgi:GntR family transcriptional regulator, transcriptional repressor for pyruvate dehydrogenase complex